MVENGPPGLLRSRFDIRAPHRRKVAVQPKLGSVAGNTRTNKSEVNGQTVVDDKLVASLKANIQDTHIIFVKSIGLSSVLRGDLKVTLIFKIQVTRIRADINTVGRQIFIFFL